MRIFAIVRPGYIRLTMGTALASLLHKVVSVDKGESKIEKLKSGDIPIYTPGLNGLLNTHKSNIKFTCKLSKAVNNNEIIFICVKTKCKTCSKCSNLRINKSRIKNVVVHAIIELLIVYVRTWSIIKAVITDFENKDIISILDILNYSSIFLTRSIVNEHAGISIYLFILDLWREKAFYWGQCSCLALINITRLNRNRGNDISQYLENRGLITLAQLQMYNMLIHFHISCINWNGRR
jgi:hypothetical protein